MPSCSAFSCPDSPPPPQLAVRAWIASKVWYKERILLADHALENASFAKAGGSQGMLNDVDDEEDEEEAEGCARHSCC